MKKIFNLLIGTTAVLLSQQISVATDYDMFTPQANSGSQSAGGNEVGQLVLSIQQSSKISDKSKHINVLYKDGSVIISGAVENDSDRQEIGNLAAKCGITNIKNELTVKSSVKK